MEARLPGSFWQSFFVVRPCYHLWPDESHLVLIFLVPADKDTMSREMK